MKTMIFSFIVLPLFVGFWTAIFLHSLMWASALHIAAGLVGACFWVANHWRHRPLEDRITSCIGCAVLGIVSLLFNWNGWCKRYHRSKHAH